LRPHKIQSKKIVWSIPISSIFFQNFSKKTKSVVGNDQVWPFRININILRGASWPITLRH
jgi:hypothetical protein